MKIGFALPVSGSWATPDGVRHVAKRAEELGYHSVWTFQRLLSDVDGGGGETYRSVLDPLMTLSYVAAVTERVRLGVAVVNLPFITPVLLAKQAATIDVLSGGRLDLGLGLGWAEEEYVASGTTKQGVGRRAVEFIEVLRALWTDREVDHHGEFYQVPRSRQDPRPIQRPHPPILMGAFAPAALRRAGARADGWISSSRADLTTLEASIDIVRAAARAAGRDPDTLRFICRGVVKVRTGLPDRDEPDGPSRPRLTGSLEQVRADCEALAAKGLTELFVDLNFDPLVGSPDADPAASMRHADEVLAALTPASFPESVSG
jgi:probable F420-dependent oxidoreductase